ncbi:MAG: hypothetical protein WCC53_05325 [Thermoanaerobaculia bacterium]|jgi:hypothetical protein
MTRKSYVLGASLFVLCLACGKKASEAPKPDAGAAASTAPATAAAPGDLSGATMTKFRFGSGIGADGTVSFETSTLAEGDAACASFDVNDAAAGAKVRVAWLHQPDNKSVARDEGAVTREKPSLSFKADTRTWPLGNYVMETTLARGEETLLLGTFAFKLEKGPR